MSACIEKHLKEDETYPELNAAQTETDLEKKYEVVRSCYNTLNDESQPAIERINKMRNKLSNEDQILNKHRDHFFIRFLKGVATILTVGLYSLFTQKTPGKFFQSCHSYNFFKPRGQSFQRRATKMINTMEADQTPNQISVH